MKIASWNVNSLKVRLPHLLDWLAEAQPDVVCLQELKLEDPNFPRAEIEAAGYHAAFAGQKTYNGVALLAKVPISEVTVGNPLFADEQKRLISGTVDGIRVVCAYMPNGQEVGCDKYDYKLRWLAGLALCFGLNPLLNALGLNLYMAAGGSGLPVIVEPAQVMTILLGAVLLSFSATLYPASRAARVKPAEALRYE